MCKHILFNNFQKKTDLPLLRSFIERTYDQDGYGAILRYSSGELGILKALDSSLFYFDLLNEIAARNIQTLVVHHRTSTNGEGLEYAHPFEYQGHYLTHNGVVTVPGTHKTLTRNDSEALLHHLVKTKYETKTIQGYYSAFILTKKKTQLIVDATAPIYTNGRVYSSHNLEAGWEKIEKKHITWNLKTGLETTADIEVAVSSYGRDKAYLSLGTTAGTLSEYDSYAVDYSDDLPVADYSRDYRGAFRSDYKWPKKAQDNVEDFLDMLSPEESIEIETTLERAGEYNALAQIVDLAWSFGLNLQPDEAEYLLAEFKLLKEA